jgi:hypothetical protein
MRTELRQANAPHGSFVRLHRARRVVSPLRLARCSQVRLGGAVRRGVAFGSSRLGTLHGQMALARGTALCLRRPYGASQAEERRAAASATLANKAIGTLATHFCGALCPSGVLGRAARARLRVPVAMDDGDGARRVPRRANPACAAAPAHAGAPRRRATEADAGCSDAVRFQLELEFVQCLANPRYVNCA